MSLMSFMATRDKSLMASIKLKLTDGVVSIGKVAPRPTMSAGYITYAFCTDANPQYYYNAGQGLKTIKEWLSTNNLVTEFTFESIHEVGITGKGSIRQGCE